MCDTQHRLWLFFCAKKRKKLNRKSEEKPQFTLSMLHKNIPRATVRPRNLVSSSCILYVPKSYMQRANGFLLSSNDDDEKPSWPVIFCYCSNQTPINNFEQIKEKMELTLRELNADWAKLMFYYLLNQSRRV